MKTQILFLFYFMFYNESATLLAATKVDEVKTSQSSTGWLGKKSCIVVNKTRERLCNKRAEKFCNAHQGAKECRKFQNIDVSKL